MNTGYLDALDDPLLCACDSCCAARPKTAARRRADRALLASSARRVLEENVPDALGNPGGAITWSRKRRAAP